MTLPPKTSAATTASHEPFGASPSLLGGRYRLEEPLAEGARGIVWRARHLGLHRDFALKLLRTGALHDPDAQTRFHREAEALGRLRHPHIVEVTDFGVDPETGVPFLVMELLPGRTLADLLRETGALPAARALPLLEALAGAIDAAHAQGILHRDLKPSNIALTTDLAGNPLLKVLDFGLAQVSAQQIPHEPAEGITGDESLTSTGMLLGTPLYAAPEVIRGGAAGSCSDIYSLGVIAYEMLAGKPPFQGSTSRVLAAHLQEEPPVPALPKAVCEALHEALRKEPELRPATARDFVRRLHQAVERSAAAQWRKAELPRRGALAAAIAAASLAAGLLLFPAGIPPAERRLDDLRMETADTRQPDPRILLVSIDESSLREGSVPLAGRAEEFGRSLEAMFAAGARGVAVDLLLPAQWRDSPAFTDVVLRHPETLTLAAFSGEDGNVGGLECVSGLTTAALGPERAAALFGFVNLDEDAKGVVRSSRLSFHDRDGVEHPSFAARAASMLGALPRLPVGSTFRIDHRVNRHLYTRILWRDLAAALVRQPDLFRDRLVLVGGDSPGSGDDDHDIPVSLGKTGKVSGLTLQALQVDTIAAGLPVREAQRMPILLLAALTAGGAALAILLWRRAGRVAAALLAAGALYAAASLPVFNQTGLLLPVTAPCLTAALGLAAALALRRALPRMPSEGSSSS
jgi:CHASE2 domain-containing sensor protein/tRNA A-37 threonylcarbamoyl transferase component Bud32